MTLDTPDYSRGVVAPRLLLGRFTSADTTGGVTLPSTVTCLAVWTNVQGGTDNHLEVIGDQSSIDYPVFVAAEDVSSHKTPPFLVPVEPAMDTSLTLNWTLGPFNDWFVVGDTSYRVTAALPFVFQYEAM